MRANKKLAAATLASMALFGASKSANAYANLIPAIKVGNGWVTVVSYVNTQGPPALGNVFVHATYQVKNPNNLTERCTHYDGPSQTTINDLTTTYLDTPNGGRGIVFPSSDTVGTALIAPPDPTRTGLAEGFLVLENYDNTGAIGGDGTLTSEAIIFNIGQGFLYSQRGLVVNHNAPSPGGNVELAPAGIGTEWFNALGGQPSWAGAATGPGNNTLGGTLARFAFLPLNIATTGAYVIAANAAGTTEAIDNADSLNLVSADYNARIGLEARMDAAQGYNLGVYNRLEDFRSVTRRNDIVCFAQLSPQQMTDPGLSGFIGDGGWYNISPRCRETENGGVTFIECNINGAGIEFGDEAVVYKVEFARGYGYAVTPQHQQWYTK